MSEECVLISGGFASLVQLVLGLLALSALVYKRYIESPKRPFQIWTLDVSKQCIGGLLAHLLNILIADVLASSDEHDQCAWYLVNFVLDTTVGVVIAWALHCSVERFGRKHSMRPSGDYGVPVSYRTWGLQVTIWCLIMMITKLLVFVAIEMLGKPLGEIGKWVMSPLAEHPRVELVLVMIIGPCMLNVVQFWVVDNILKQSTSSSDEETADAVIPQSELEKVAEPVDMPLLDHDPDLGRL